MKINITDEWCKKMAALELQTNCDISVISPQLYKGEEMTITQEDMLNRIRFLQEEIRMQTFVSSDCPLLHTELQEALVFATRYRAAIIELVKNLRPDVL